MKSTILLLFALLISVAFVSSVEAQDPTQPPPSQQQPQQSPNPVSTVDNQGIRNYLLGPGDVLDVRVFGQGDLNAVVDVDNDGYISKLPFVEAPILAKCRTENAVQKDIVAAYSKYLKNPQVSVRISDRKSRQPVAVWGAVRLPSRFPLNRKIRLNELLAATGGFTDRAAGTIQILHTEPLMCPGPGEEAEGAPLDPDMIPLNVVRIADLKAAKPGANPVIRPGDYIFVIEAEPVFLTGSVVAPQPVLVRDQLTLSVAIARAGGLRKEANMNDVRIFRQKPGSKEQETIRVDLAAIKKNKAPDVLLQPYDIVEVPEAGYFSSTRLATTFMSLFTGGVQSMMGTLPTRAIP